MSARVEASRLAVVERARAVVRAWAALHERGGRDVEAVRDEEEALVGAVEHFEAALKRASRPRKVRP